MSRRGNCWENAPQESFFGHMKSELKMKAAKWKTPQEAELAINDWMDYYNNDRYQRGLENLAPNEYYQYIMTGIYPVSLQEMESPKIN
jgi:transposase InsO family protein